MSSDAVGAVLSDRAKSKEAAQFIGHAFVTAWNFIRLNRDAIQRVADKLVVEKEIFGNDLTELLDAQNLQLFVPTDAENFKGFEAWPVL